MMHEWRTPIPVRTPLGDAECLLVIDYGYNVNTVWLCRMHGSGEVKHFESSDVQVYGNPMDGRGWDVTRLPVDPQYVMRNVSVADTGRSSERLVTPYACPLARPFGGAGVFCTKHGELALERFSPGQGLPTELRRCPWGCPGEHQFVVDPLQCAACCDELEKDARRAAARVDDTKVRVGAGCVLYGLLAAPSGQGSGIYCLVHGELRRDQADRAATRILRTQTSRCPACAGMRHEIVEEGCPMCLP